MSGKNDDGNIMEIIEGMKKEMDNMKKQMSYYEKIIKEANIDISKFNNNQKSNEEEEEEEINKDINEFKDDNKIINDKEEDINNNNNENDDIDYDFANLRPDLYQSIRNFIEFVQTYPHMWPSNADKKDILLFLEPFSTLPFMLPSEFVLNYLKKTNIIDKDGKLALENVDDINIDDIDKDMWDIVYHHFKNALEKEENKYFNEDYLRIRFKSDLDFIRMTWQARKQCYIKIIEWIKENRDYIYERYSSNIKDFVFLLMIVSSCNIKNDPVEIYNELKKRNIIIEHDELNLSELESETNNQKSLKNSLCLIFILVMLITSMLIKYDIL